jgi:23S rRNA pseudouridine2605 synthase
VRLDDGVTAPARVRRVSEAVLEVAVHEGRKRQVRRMCEAVGHPVRRLQRVAFGPLALGELPLGAWRRLGEDEIRALAAPPGPGRATKRSRAAPPRRR